jgi:hypothetical protein
VFTKWVGCELKALEIITLTSYRQRHDSLFQLVVKIKRDIPFLNSFEKEVSGMNQISLQPEVTGSYRLTKTNLGSSTYELYLSFGTLRIRLLTYAVASKRQKDGARKSLIVKPNYRQTLITFIPNSNKCPMLEWTFGHQFNSIKAGLQSFNLRPGWSAISEFCSSGDLESVLKLIEEGHASPYDIDPDGWTPLHVSLPFISIKAGRLRVSLIVRCRCTSYRNM